MFVNLWEQFTESYSTSASYYGVYGVMFLLSLLYIIIRKTQSWKRAVMVYTLLVMVVLVMFNPVYYKILTKVVSSYDVYYRLFWMIPFDIVIGYVCVDIVATIKDRRKRVIFASLVLIVLVAGGDLVYFFDGGGVKATYFGNIYKVDQQAIDITDAIVSDDRNSNKKTISSTDEMFALRGYDALFGIVEVSSMESAAVNADALAHQMQAAGAGYAVIEKELCDGYGLVEDGQVRWVMSTAGYEVYVLVN